jgi:DNA-directed RNA polymerase specialized sigma24 family protein
MVKYRKMIAEADATEKSRPIVPDYIGRAIMLICANLSKKGNFAGYTYDLVGDGILDCIAAVDNFNPDKTNNPFAYFTKIAWNAYIRRISKEKKQNYVKHKYFETTLLNDMVNSGEVSRNLSHEEVIRSFESTMEKSKIKKKTKVDTATS